MIPPAPVQRTWLRENFSRPIAGIFGRSSAPWHWCTFKLPQCGRQAFWSPANLRVQRLSGIADKVDMRSFRAALKTGPALTAILIATSLPVVQAQSGPADAQTVQELIQEVRALRLRVLDLEQLAASDRRGAEAKPEPPAATTATVPAPEVASVPPPAMDDGGMSHASHSVLNSPSLNFHGYADLGYRATNSAGGTNGFLLGQADLFITSKLSDDLSFLMETAVDADSKNVPGIEIERMFLTYRLSDYLNINAGRYHTAIGYFNGAFHHGKWFQTLVDRPFLFEFEDAGGILPIHNTGLSVDGRLPSGSLNLHYVAEIGNGRAYKTPDAVAVQVAGDENNGKAVNFALYTAPAFLPGWQVGASVYRDRLTPDGLSKIQQTIYSFHTVYERDRTEFIAEGVLMHHVRTIEGATNVPAFYTQLAYRTRPSLKPFARIEFMNAAASDPIARPLLGTAGYRRSVEAGIRYELAEFCAWKVQVGGLQRRDLPVALIGSMQLAFIF
jgi:hypothetical protein